MTTAALAADERPATTIPEPTRNSGAAVRTVVALSYLQALEGVDIRRAALPELVKYFNSEVGAVSAPVVSREDAIEDASLGDALMVCITGNEANLVVSVPAKKQLGEYLRNGGLIFGDDIRPTLRRGFRRSRAGTSGTPFDRQFKELIRDPNVLGAEGARWRPMPNTHPLYSSFFQFPDGPPLSGARGAMVESLESLEVRGRVAVIFSDLNISVAWGDPMSSDQRRLQFGANLIVFAMTRQAAGARLR